MSGRGMAQKSLGLIERCKNILEEIQPTTVRSVCYQLFTRGLIESMSRNETAKVSRLLVAARESGAIPWSYIVDETREAERISGWRGLGDYSETILRCFQAISPPALVSKHCRPLLLVAGPGRPTVYRLVAWKTRKHPAAFPDVPGDLLRAIFGNVTEP
jgi:hypothetical protein